MLNVLFSICSSGGGSINKCFHYCLIVSVVIPASSAECERHFSAFNPRSIITSQYNMMFPETVEALPIILEGGKNKLIQ